MLYTVVKCGDVWCELLSYIPRDRVPPTAVLCLRHGSSAFLLILSLYLNLSTPVSTDVCFHFAWRKS